MSEPLLSPATSFALSLVVGTLAAPVLSLLTLGGGGRLTSPKLTPHLASLALGVGFITALIGALGSHELWRLSPRAWLCLAPMLGLMALSVTRPRRLSERLTPLLALSVGAWGVLSAHARLWGEGAELVWREAWLIEPLLTSLGVMWLLMSSVKPSSDEPLSPPITPQLGALALSYGGGAVALAASGSASTGQLLGAMGLSVAVVGLWRWRAELKGEAQGAQGAQGELLALVYLPLALTLLYAHHYLSPALSSKVAWLLLIAPLGALASTLRAPLSTLKRTLTALLATALLLALALAVVASVELAKQAESAESDPYGATY